MNKKAKIFLTIGMATLLLGTGTAMAAATTDASKSTTVKSDYMARGNAMHGEKGFGAPFNNKELLDLLKITADDLKQSAKDGKSLADLASAKGVTEQQVIDLIVKQQQTHLSDAVKNGKLTQDQADKMSANFADKAKQMVEGKPGDMHFHGKDDGKGFVRLAGPFNNAELATFLKLDAATLKQKMAVGTQTLTEIAAAQGISKDQLTSFLVEQNTKQLDEAVKSGKLQQDRADQMKKDFPNMVQKMIDNKPGAFKEKREFHKDAPHAKSSTQQGTTTTN